jgi:hypothetical protein
MEVRFLIERMVVVVAVVVVAAAAAAAAAVVTTEKDHLPYHHRHHQDFQDMYHHILHRPHAAVDQNQTLHQKIGLLFN